MTSPAVLKGKRGAMTLAISLLMLIGGFALLVPMEEADADPTSEASLSINGGEAVNYGTLTEALEAYKNSTDIGDFKITLLSSIVNIADSTNTGYYIIEQLVEKNLTIDGANNNVTAQFFIDGNSRMTSETLTIHDVVFGGKLVVSQAYETDNHKDDAFIWCYTASGEVRYPHNMTIRDCVFNLDEGGEYTTDYEGHVAIKIKQAKNITIEGCETYGGHSLLQASGITGLMISGCEIHSDRGVNLVTSTNVLIENTTIEAEDKYGVRLDETSVSGGYSVEIRDCTIRACDPVVLRSCASTDNCTMYFTGSGTIESTKDRPWFVATDGKYDEGDDPPTTDTEHVNVIVSNPALNMADMKGVSATPSNAVAIVSGPEGITQYTELRSAFEYISTATPTGTYILTLLADVNNIETPFTIQQNEGINITLDGAGKKFTGQIFIDGNNRDTGEETVEIKNIKFEGELGTTLEHYFIDCNIAGTKDGYAHNVTISGCTFTMPNGDDSYAGIRFRQAYNITVDGCTFTGGNGAYWGTGGSNLVFSNLDISRVAEGGLSIGTTNGTIRVENCTISGAQYAIRADANIGSTTANLSITGGRLDAKVPVTIRYVPNGTYNVSFGADVEVKPDNLNELGYWVVVSDAAYYGDEGTTPSSSKPVYITAPASVKVFAHEHITSCESTQCGCGEPVEGSGHQYSTTATCVDRTCIVCENHTENLDSVSPVHEWDSQYPCLAETCLRCYADYPTPADHDPNSDRPCEVSACEVCHSSMDPAPHSVPYDCDEATCTVCGDTVPAAEGATHDLPSTATCIDRTCADCGTVVKATKSHDYRTIGYQNVCRDCGHTVDLPFQDDDDDWYLQWLAQQQAKAEAERLAKERAEQEAEEKKKVAAVALATGVALIMALLLMSTYRRS